MTRLLSDNDTHRPMAQLDLTPLIGVLLALVAVFALSVPRVNDLTLGIHGNDGPTDWFGAPRALIDIDIARDGAVSWDGRRMSRPEFEQHLAAIDPERPPYFSIHVQRQVRYAAFDAGKGSTGVLI
jgi:biopolymer transport protein ExbD